VIPLVVSYVFSGVVSIGETRRTGRLAGYCFLTFVALVGLAIAYSVPMGYALSSFFTVDPETLESLRALAPETAMTAGSGVTSSLSFGQSLSRLVPSNLFKAAAEEQILGLVLAALVFGLAATRIEPKHREILTGVFKAVAEATMVVVVWILWVMPMGVFALAYVTARQTGWEAALAFGYWVVAAPAVLLGFILLLYGVAAAVGRVGIVRFARAMAPAQLVAAGSRSSLASIPALLEGAEEHLGYPESFRGFVIPLSSAAFKVSGPLGSPLQLFILAKLYGIELDPATVGVFVVGLMLLAFATPGIPSGGFTLRLPLFVAAGIPLEGFMLTTALDAIPDIFKTMANVTGDMTVLAVVGRFAGIQVESAPSQGLD
jgi:Na+/H+-dicarboxylate symporter